jgi:ribonuclease VapC
MIVDSSALIAILFNEEDARQYFEAIEQSTVALIAAPTLLETTIVVVSAKGPSAALHLDILLNDLQVKTLDFNKLHADESRMAFLKYGKGQGHPAQLNFGDCISYAASKVEMMPLLFKGEDFRKTDVDCAI